MSNKIYEVQKELDRGFHLYGYTNRIAVYGPRPSARRLFGKRKITMDPILMTTKDHVSLYFPISYRVLCGNYGSIHEHKQYEDDSDPLDYMITMRIQTERCQEKIECFPRKTTVIDHYSSMSDHYSLQ